MPSRNSTLSSAMATRTGSRLAPGCPGRLHSRFSACRSEPRRDRPAPRNPVPRSESAPSDPVIDDFGDQIVVDHFHLYGDLAGPACFAAFVRLSETT